MLKKISMILMMMLSGVCSVQAVDITFSTSGTISAGDTYDTVYVQNDGTVVDMTGGQIGRLWLHDSSIFNMDGGNITGGIDAHGLSYFDMTGGSIDADSVILYGLGGSFSGGNIVASNTLKISCSSVVEITGGTFDINYLDGHFTMSEGIVNAVDISVAYEGTIEIKGGQLTADDVYFCDYSTVNIYGDKNSFNYNQMGKLLTGNLFDGNYLGMGGVDWWEYEQLNFVPEPTTLLLFGFGALILRKRN